MSRGPGHLQRLILTTLQKRGCFYVADILPPEHSASDYKALLRAAQSWGWRNTWEARMVLAPARGAEQSTHDESTQGSDIDYPACV